MPFITEELYQALPHDVESIMISEYPEYTPALDFPEDEARMQSLIAAVKAVRNRRAEMNVPPSKKATVFIKSEKRDAFNETTSGFFTRLASASDVVYIDEYKGEDAVSIITDDCAIYIPLSEVVDFEKEKARLEGELVKTQGEIDRLEKKLSNEGFVAKAPAAVVDGERAKLKAYKEKADSIAAEIAKYNK